MMIMYFLTIALSVHEVITDYATLLKLTNHDLSTILSGMSTVKISSKVEAAVWEELRALAKESHQNVSELLTEAISDYLRRRRVRPVVLDHLADSMNENEELGKLLAFYQPPGITAMLCRDAH